MTLFSTERDPLVRYKPLKVQRQWLKLYGLLLIFAYAFIALFIQGTPPIWIRTTVDGFLREYPAINYPEVRGFLNLLLGVLHPLYWLHFLPLIGGAWLGRILTLRFLQNFYELANLDEARLLWDRLRNGSTAKYDPNKSESQDFNAQSINQIGGPGYVKLPAPTPPSPNSTANSATSSSLVKKRATLPLSRPSTPSSISAKNLPRP